MDTLNSFLLIFKVIGVYDSIYGVCTTTILIQPSSKTIKIWNPNFKGWAKIYKIYFIKLMKVTYEEGIHVLGVGESSRVGKDG